MDEDAGSAGVPLVLRKEGLQLIGGVEGRHGIEGHGHLEAGVAVAGGDAGYPVSVRELCRLFIVPLERDAAVEYLDHVDLADLGQVSQWALADMRTAERIEWVRDADQAALAVDLVGGLVRAEAARDGLGEEHADDLAVGGRDLLAQDDGQPVGQSHLGDLVADGDRALDVVVVRHGNMREAALDGLLDELLLGTDRGAAEPSVDVEVGECLLRRRLAPAGRLSLLGEHRPQLRRRGRYRHEWLTRLFRNWPKFSSAMPVPTATEFSAFSATWHGMPVTWVSSLSRFRSSAPPPVMTIPLSMMSELSSGGVCSSTLRTAVMIAWSGCSIASVISVEVSGMVRGSTAIMLRPLTSLRNCSSIGST